MAFKVVVDLKPHEAKALYAAALYRQSEGTLPHEDAVALQAAISKLDDAMESPVEWHENPARPHRQPMLRRKG